MTWFHRFVGRHLWLPLALAALACDHDDSAQDGAAASSAQAPVKKAEARFVTFRPAPPEPGREQRITRKSKLQLAVEFWSEQERWGTNEQRREEEYIIHEKLLKRLGRAAGKVKATYEDYRLLQDEADAPEREDAHLEGRTYIVDRTQGELTVTTEKGEPVSEAEEQNIRIHYAKLGEMDPVVEALGTKPIRVDKQFPLRIKLYEALLAGSQGDYKGGRIEVTGVRTEAGRKVAALRWNAKFERDEGNGMKSIWDVQGKTDVVVAPAQVITQKMDGVITVEGRTKKEGTWLRIAGDGTMSDDYRVEPL